MNDQPSAALSFVLKPDNISVFFSFLQQGVQISARVGCDIQSLLCDQYGLMPEYLSDRINTIFLNGKPVDDVSKAVVRDGDTLALSAAMPGLVGATFRKSGCLASFRGSITYQNEDDAMTAGHDGRITLKLFNLLISEMGPAFLAHGIWVSGRMLLDFLAAHPLEPRRLFKEIKKNGEDIDPERFNDLDWISPEGRIFLQGACDPRVSAAT